MRRGRGGYSAISLKRRSLEQREAAAEAQAPQPSARRLEGQKLGDEMLQLLAALKQQRQGNRAELHTQLVAVCEDLVKEHPRVALEKDAFHQLWKPRYELLKAAESRLKDARSKCLEEVEKGGDVSANLLQQCLSAQQVYSQHVLSVKAYLNKLHSWLARWGSTQSGRTLMSRCLCYIGDVERYENVADIANRELDVAVSTGQVPKDKVVPLLANAVRSYEHAWRLDPSVGMPCNQLGVAHQTKGDAFAAAYFYMRAAMAVKKPFPASLQNLFKVLTHFYAKMNNSSNNTGSPVFRETEFPFCYVAAATSCCLQIVAAAVLPHAAPVSNVVVEKEAIEGEDENDEETEATAKHRDGCSVKEMNRVESLLKADSNSFQQKWGEALLAVAENANVALSPSEALFLRIALFAIFADHFLLRSTTEPLPVSVVKIVATVLCDVLQRGTESNNLPLDVTEDIGGALEVLLRWSIFRAQWASLPPFTSLAAVKNSVLKNRPSTISEAQSELNDLPIASVCLAEDDELKGFLPFADHFASSAEEQQQEQEQDSPSTSSSSPIALYGQSAGADVIHPCGTVVTAVRWAKLNWALLVAMGQAQQKQGEDTEAVAGRERRGSTSSSSSSSDDGDIIVFDPNRTWH